MVVAPERRIEPIRPWFPRRPFCPQHRPLWTPPQMAVAPTLVTAVASVYNTGATTAKTVSLPCQAGDFLVVRAQGEDGNRLFANPPTNNGAALTWTSRGNVGTTGSTTRCAAWTAVADTTRTIVVSVAPTDASTTLWWGIIGKVWRGSDGFDSSNAGLSTVSAAVTLSVTTTTDNCALDFGVGDFSAADRSNTANYLTSAGSVVEDTYFINATHYTVNEAHHPDVGAAAAKSVGRNESYKWAMVVVAVKGSAAGAARPHQRRGTITRDLLGPARFGR